MKNRLVETWESLEKELNLVSFIESFLKNPLEHQIDESVSPKALRNLIQYLGKNQAVISDVNSSVLQTVEYQPKKQKLILTFQNGRQYEYFDVPPEVVIRLFRARSHGKSFRKFIRGKPERGVVPYDYDEV